MTKRGQRLFDAIGSALVIAGIIAATIVVFCAAPNI